MPRPTSSTTIQRPDLGALAYEHHMNADRMGFIGGRIFPIFEVDEKSADYPIITIESVLKNDENLERAPRSAYSRDDWEFETGTYSCKEYGKESPVDEVEANLYKRFFDAEQVAVRRTSFKLLLHREIRIAGKIFNTSNFTPTSITNEWDDAANCTPKADIDGRISAMEDAIGISPNVVAMNKKVFRNCMKSAELKDYLKYTNPHLLKSIEAQRAMLADYFGVDEVLVAGGMYDSAAKGQAASLARIWSDEYIWVGRIAMVDPTAETPADLEEPCIGRTFLWTEDSPEIITTEQYEEPQTRSQVYRSRHNLDEAFVFTACGQLLDNATT